MAATVRVFSTSLTCLPKFTSTDVVKSVEIHSSTKGNKLDKGYKFFHEEFIHNYQGFCNHIVVILYQTAHYSQLGLQAVPPPLACTSGLQRWHRPRTQGIHPEPVSELVVQKPKTVGQNGLRSTLYKAYTGPLPDPYMMASGSKLSQVQPQPLMAVVLDGVSEIELTHLNLGLSLVDPPCPITVHPRSPATSSYTTWLQNFRPFL
ncbi:uncharacterized protein LOC127642737 [Xyrauchen texanus]|uniref:uncharacterized protein LOC127642737 n=1 Tax=Xyrauchen texanus TaxID=154827 RepID=UPI002242905C|nr:uncharacterized protein LOC127642737 [Xyrauchen texanus]